MTIPMPSCPRRNIARLVLSRRMATARSRNPVPASFVSGPAPRHGFAAGHYQTEIVTAPEGKDF